MKNCLNRVLSFATKHCLSISIFALIVSFASLVATYAMADTAPAFGDSVLGLISAIKVGSLGAILLAVGQLIKSDFISGLIGTKINPKAIPWINTAVGILAGVGTSLVQGKPWYLGAIEGILANFAAMGVYNHTEIAK